MLGSLISISQRFTFIKKKMLSYFRDKISFPDPLKILFAEQLPEGVKSSSININIQLPSQIFHNIILK